MRKLGRIKLIPCLLVASLLGCGRPITDVEVVSPLAYKAGRDARHLSAEEQRKSYQVFLSRFVNCPPTVELKAVMAKEFHRGARK